MKYMKIFTGAITILAVSGCVHLVSYYDSLSYKNLTDLKGEAKVFFESCQQEIAKGDSALAAIDGFVLSSAKAYEYEKGKSLNDDTVSQLKVIEKTVSEVKLRYAMNKYENAACAARGGDEAADVASGCLTTGYCTAKWRVLETAFDIAISTEQSKLEKSN
jgi:hypothetical protein